MSFIVAWFRPDPGRTLVRVWALGSVLVTIGLLLAALSMLPTIRWAEWLQVAGFFAGLVLILTGLLIPVRRAVRLLSDDTCLVLRGDGVFFQCPPAQPVLVRWETLMRAEVGEGGFLQLLRDGMTPVTITHRFLDIDTPALAKHINDTQRRALMGLLHPPRRPVHGVS